MFPPIIMSIDRQMMRSIQLQAILIFLTFLMAYSKAKLIEPFIKTTGNTTYVIQSTGMSRKAYHPSVSTIFIRLYARFLNQQMKWEPNTSGWRGIIVWRKSENRPFKTKALLLLLLLLLLLPVKYQAR
jgi:hypothetical protein